MAKELDRAPWHYAGKKGLVGFVTYFFKRGFAFWVDLTVLSLLVVGAVFIYVNVQIAAVQPIEVDWVYIFYFLSMFLYFFLFEWLFEQTPGKACLELFQAAWCKLRRRPRGRRKGLVVISTDQRRVRCWQAAVRNIPRAIPIVMFVDMAFAFFTKRKQRLFEKISGTVVVETEALKPKAYGVKE